MKRAFTLIELMVVVTIIAILAVIVVVNLDKARVKSRDAQRKADLTRIASALERYKADNKRYPVRTVVWADADSVTELNNYISAIPIDPLNNDVHYKYLTDAPGGAYKLLSQSESLKGKSDTDIIAAAGDFYNPPGSGLQTCFQVSSSNSAISFFGAQEGYCP